MDKFFKWSISETGRKVFSYLAAGGISSAGALSFLPHTIFVDYYVDFIRLYRKGLTVPVNEETKKKFETVLDILKVPPENKYQFRPFNVVGFDAVNVGTTFSKWGAFIGVPPNFSYKTETDVDTAKMRLNGECITWGTEAGQKLMKSLVISEKAQYYALAREIKMADTPKVLFNSLLAISCAFATYALSQSLNKKFNFYIKPAGLRIVLYTLVSSFTLGNYFFMKDLIQVHYEQKIDEEIKNNYPSLAEGAKEYYSKLLLRNMCYRILLGKDGESSYTPLGNEIYFIRMKTTPLMQRREFFE